MFLSKCSRAATKCCYSPWSYSPCLGLQRKRNLLQATGIQPPSGKRHMSDDSQKTVEIYQGPLQNAVKILKTVSLTTSFLSTLITPLAVTIGPDTMPLAAKLAFGGTISLFAISTTGVMHYATKTYIRKITCSESDLEAIDSANNVAALDNVELTVETLTLLSRPLRSTFPISALHFPEYPVAFVSFEVTGRKFFLHRELVNQDPRLLKLFPALKDNENEET
eukprot:m.48623 g.48623  ORF g.48623 m.48623 type:complete len:222 (+) comp10574_c0_seq3:145-810(+)